jgi:hypothetical protein
MIGRRPWLWWRICWQGISPLLLFVSTLMLHHMHSNSLLCYTICTSTHSYATPYAQQLTLMLHHVHSNSLLCYTVCTATHSYATPCAHQDKCTVTSFKMHVELDDHLAKEGFRTLLVFQGILLFSWVDYSPARYGDVYFPAWADALGWLMSLCSIIWIPIMAVYKVYKDDGPVCEVMS